MKFLIIDSVHDILINKLKNFGIETIYIENLTYDKALEIVENFDGIIIRSKFKLDETLLKKAKKLKCIGRIGSGMENIDVKVAQELNIACFNSPEGNRNAVAEHALGMLLSLLNNICKSYEEIKKGIWLREENRGTEIKGKTIGIIGYGNTGSEFCKKLVSFDCRILVYDKYKSGFGNSTILETSLEHIQKEADIISFHVPLTKETYYYFDYTFINNCKKPFYLINTSRGSIVNTKALLNGLKEKKILGAALDVLEFEDTSFEKISMNNVFSELLKLPNVIITPHIAGWTNESKIILAEVLANKIIDYLNDARRKQNC
jgi:D-3-phosphoglycerate dehydrogenase